MAIKDVSFFCLLLIPQSLQSNILIKYLITLILAASIPFSCFAELPDAKTIRSVWDMKTSCKGMATNSMSRNAEEVTIQSTKQVVLKDLGFSFKIPQLPQVDETIIKLQLKDKSRGVVDNYILISDQDLEPPFASVVITELPPSMTTREQAFAAVNTLENQLAKKSGYIINLEKINGPHGKSLEMIVPNRVGSYCFPTSDFKFLPKDYKTSTVGISRFSFIRGMLVEFSLIVAIPDNIDKSESVPFAKNVMDDFWGRLKEI